MTILIDATYSAEDNKLRLYASERLDTELYQRVKDAGFRWAPKQGLFVAPKWTPGREDLCIELAGEITAEQTTMAERAEAKAERLDNLAEKRAGQASAFQDAARSISQRFEAGQPILVGHHSERRARKDKERMNSAMEKAVKAHDAVSYWNYRAEGVEHHANHKSNPRVRARRIKTLLAELRDMQRRINHAHFCLKLWTRIDQTTKQDEQDKAALHWSGTHLGGGSVAPNLRGDSLWSLLDRGEMSTSEVIEKCLAHWEFILENPHYSRWVSHILNRLGYERAELGPVIRFEGELTPVILQAFAREHGAEKPKAKEQENGFVLTSLVALPVHLAQGSELALSADEWRDLMQSAGYEVVVKVRRPSKKQTCPLINPTPEQAEKLQVLWNASAEATKYGKASERLETTQPHYSANSKGDYGRYSTISLDELGNRVWSSNRDAVPVCRIRVGSGSGLYAADRVITLTDKPQKALPLDLDAIKEAEAA
tara:strand:- start:17911 stop:19362 length:1452 start_codon:yes stop_codon:yes gene_type:complete